MTTPPQPPLNEPKPKSRRWYTRRWAQLLAVALVALSIGGAVGNGGATSADNKRIAAEKVAKSAQADMKKAQADAAQARSDADIANKRADSAESTAQTKAKADLKVQVDAANATLKQEQAAVKTREDAVAKREAAAGIAEKTAAANTFAGDGTYLVGTDIQPGTYRADAAPSPAVAVAI